MGTDPAVARRVAIVDFDYKVKEEDIEPDFVNRFYKKHGSGILNWLLEGAREFLENGIQLPESVKVKSREYMDELNYVKNFLTMLADPDYCNEINITMSDKILLPNLLKGFNYYCEEEGLKRRISTQNLGKELRLLGLEVRKSTGNKTYVFNLPAWLQAQDFDMNKLNDEQQEDVLLMLKSKHSIN